MISPVTNGRTASCTRTTSSLSAAAATAFSAFSTDCWRCSPPTTSSTFFFKTSFSLESRVRKPSISLSRRATQISLTLSTPANFRSVWRRIGVPPNSVNCFEGGAFRFPLAPTGMGAMRVPSPAAGMITTTFIAGSKYTGASEGVQIQKQFTAEREIAEKTPGGLFRFLSAPSAGSAVDCRAAAVLRLRLGLDQRIRDHRRRPRCTWDCRHYGLDHATGAGKGAFVPFAENHFPRCRLQHGCDRDVDSFADHFPCVVHDHHGAVIEIGDTLVVFLTFFEDEDLHDLAGQHDGLERVRQLVNVQYFDALQLRDFVQIEVVGDDLAFVDFGQLDQLEIHFADGGEIVFHDLDLQRGHLLQALQNVKAAAAAVALQRVGGIGHELQLAQHELRSNDDPVEEAGFGNVGDAAVNDDAGVENFVTFLALLLAAKNAAQSR